MPSSAVATLPEPLPTPWVGDAPGELSGEVTAALLRIRDVAPAQYPADFAGIATGTQESKDILVIYLADATNDTETALLEMSGLPAEKVKFEPAYQSLEAASIVDRTIMAGIQSLRLQGIELQTFGVGVDGVEDIGMDHPTDDQVAYLFDKYGPYLRIDRNVGPARLL
ncbi:hypothetical protein VD659_06010 [Herbiconiux sp. 11R-BC]|uniref:hypothetical protein n=1 Tax=Herbiconiux sp. 11R-BC TaxID=3111637 RepID=UPI003C008A26